jgi:hypothetical protein
MYIQYKSVGITVYTYSRLSRKNSDRNKTTIALDDQVYTQPLSFPNQKVVDVYEGIDDGSLS